MRPKHLFILGAVLLTAVAGTTAGLTAQTASTALSGVVRSAAEGAMEGVLVSVRRESANFTVTVVTDAQGLYSFPRSHVEPGTYAVTIRATGFDLPGATSVDVAAQTAATLNLALQPAEDIIDQLTSL